MLKFSIEKHKVTVDPISLTLEPLRDIWLSDKSKTKDEAVKLLTYIHICSQVDQNAPFAKVDPTEVSTLARREIYGSYEYQFKGKFNEAYIEETILKYQMAYDTPEQASVRAFDKKIYEINRLIDNTKIEIEKVAVRGGVDYVSNFAILNKMMQDMTKINAAKEALKNAIMKQSGQNNVRGQKQVSFLEKRRAEMNKANNLIKELETKEKIESEDEENF
jgi:hypothetical protein